MSQQGSYNMQQKVFAFSQVVNAAQTVTSGFTEAITAKFNAMTSQFPQYLGTGWSMPWGPAVYTDVHPTPGNGVAIEAADNAMILVRGSDEAGDPVYIVAVAGTNPQSVLDRTEDLEVWKVTQFNSGGAQIDDGTNKGLGILESMSPNGQTLQQYLTSVASPEATLIFTGHSLGGALSPTLALDLFVNKGMQLPDWKAVYVMPTAGPTPGNADFVTLFATTFLPSGGWNVNIVNSLDCVPLAWNNLSLIPGIYKPNIEPDAQIEHLVLFFEALRGKEKSFYETLPQLPFPGTYNSAAQPPPIHAGDPTYEFAAQALYQHIMGYIEEITPELASFFSPAPLDAAAFERLLERVSPVSAA